jgi:hypothetical protein
MPLQDGDQFIVERGGTAFQLTLRQLIDRLKTLPGSDLFAIGRGTPNYKITAAEFTAYTKGQATPLKDTDLFAVQRGPTVYNVPAAVIKPLFGSDYWFSYFPKTTFDDYVYAVDVDSSDNIISFGTIVFNQIRYGMLTKYQPSGEVIWSKYFLTSGNLNYNRNWMRIDPTDNNIYVMGYGPSLSTPNASAEALLKFNQNGDLLWAKQYLSPFPVQQQQSNVLNSFYLASNGALWVSGEFSDSLPGTAFYNGKFLLQINPNNGDIIQSKKIPTEGGIGQINYIPDGVVANRSNTSLLQYCWYTNNNNNPVRLDVAKLDNNFNAIWYRGAAPIAETGMNWSGSQVVLDSSDNILMYGGAGTETTATGWGLLKFDSELNLQWSVLYQLLDKRYPTNYQVITDEADNVYMLVYSYFTYKCYVIKISKYGAVLWVRKLQYLARGYDRCTFLTIAYNNNAIYISGSAAFRATPISAYNPIQLTAKLPADGSLTGIYEDGSFYWTDASSELTRAYAAYTSAGNKPFRAYESYGSQLAYPAISVSPYSAVDTVVPIQ